MKNIKILTTLLFLITTLVFAAATSADDVVRIKFAKGKTSTTISEAVLRGDADTYLIGAKKGQTLKIRMTSTEDNAVFRIRDGNDDLLPNAGTDEDGLTSWTGKLPETGDYKINVSSVRGNASFKMIVSIK